MNNSLSSDTKAVILLCAFFGNDSSAKPLSQKEYSLIVQWLLHNKLRPSDLLQQDNIPEASMKTGIDRNRLEYLLGRGVQLGFAVEEWHRNGIWVISRSDQDYPTRYKKRLKDKAPSLLFGVGDRALLSGGGLAIVGSRNVDSDGEEFTRRVGRLCALNGMPVVSGGARGVDQISMSSALESGGSSIGILAESLLKKSLERSYRHAIADGRLLLLSPYHPNARFSVGAAMGRNKLIYALADYGLVVSAEYKKGGTWAGAEEELRRDSSLPVFVRRGNNTPPGNSKLIEIGAIEWPNIEEGVNLNEQLNKFSKNLIENNSRDRNVKNINSLKNLVDIIETSKIEICVSAETNIVNENKYNLIDDKNLIYQAVIPIIIKKLEIPHTVDEISDSLNVSKKQMTEWIKMAFEEGRVLKLKNPVRYKAMNVFI